MAYQVLARKWRPRHFDQVIAQPHVVQALSNALQQQYLHHAYLFTGTRGVGKTTIARLLAKCLNCERGISASPCDECACCREINAGHFIDLFEVDAASRTKVEDTRELLENVPYAPSKGRFKVYLIDEVHMLSGHSFNALLKTLEEPPSHVKFLLATTDPQKLPATILSRCLQFHLLAMLPEQIDQHLQHILQAEQIPFEPAATLLISKAANGSMRDALSLLDQSIAYGNGKVSQSEVNTMLGTIDQRLLTTILTALQQQDGRLIIESVRKLSELGADFSRALADLLGLLHQIAVQQLVPDPLATNLEVLQLAKSLKSEDVQLYYQIGLLGQRDLTFAPSPRMGFEMTLLRMLAFTPQVLVTIPSKTTASYQQPINDPGITTPPTSTINTTTMASQAAPIPSTTLLYTLTSNTAWHELLPQLGIQGGTLLLAQQCQFQELKANQVRLLLHSKHQPLLQPKHIERIREALSHHLNQDIQVTVDIVNNDIETPAYISRNQVKQRQHAAEQALEEDPFVQKLKQQFGAKVLKNSITIN